MAPGKVLDFQAFLARTDVPTDDKIHRLGEEVVEHTAVERQAAVERAAIAARVNGIEILARTNALAQTVAGDATVGIATAVETIAATQADHGERLERIEEGLFVVVGAVGRIERRLDGREASDVDLFARVEREQAAREAEDARQLALIEPLIARAVAPVAVAAKAAAADEASTTRKTVALASGGLATVYTVVQILRELGVIQ